jgi:4-amino-4-deoxy-L-arabinose transferase-like glycosyltransferase
MRTSAARFIQKLNLVGWHATAALAFAAFLLRLLARLVRGEQDFWRNGYSAYYTLALRLVGGHGLCFGDGGTATCAWWPPLYPTLLAGAALTPHPYLTIVIAESLCGALTVVCVILLATRLFDRATGLLTGLLAAIYPYFVIHDTALQETSSYTCLTATAVLLLFWAAQERTWMWSILAGATMGLALLTRASLLPFVPLSLLWLLCFSGGPARSRLRSALLAGVAFSIVVAPWLIRNTVKLGAPILTSQSGRFLWIGNNRATFSHYPEESIDLSTAAAWEALTPAENRELDQIDGELARSNWFARKGREYIAAHPAMTARGALRKLAAGFGWRPSPRREPFAEAVYGASYLPVLILAFAGMILYRQFWRSHLLVYLLFFSFMLVSAVFWAHTSHRSYLDVYLTVFAAAAIKWAITRVCAVFCPSAILNLN